MAVTSAHIWYPSGVAGTGSAYDLRTITMWNPKVVGGVTMAVIRFNGTGTAPTLETPLAAFETAKQASLDAGG